MNDENRRNRSFRWLWLLVVLAIVAGGVYYVYTRDVDVMEAVRSVRTTSRDAATTAKVKTALMLSKRISAFDIDVDTNGGVVYLSGSVPAQEIKELALAITEDTADVQKVVDNLVVDETARPDPEVTRLAQRVADLELESAIQDALRRSGLTNAGAIQVKVEDRVVALDGSVDDAEVKRRADHLARSMEGVQEVTNRLTVVGGEPAPEPRRDTGKELVRQVAFDLFSAQAFDLERLDITADGGTVTLSGEVRSQAEKLLAESIARDVEGVERVVNRLLISSSPDLAEPPPDEPTTELRDEEKRLVYVM